MRPLTRRSFIARALGAAAVAPLVAQAGYSLPKTAEKQAIPCAYPRATTCYQRLYTRLEHRCMTYQSARCRSVWINGTCANGERDVFYQQQRLTERGWEPSSTHRYSHRDDINNRIISYPKRRVDLVLDLIPVGQATVPWFKDVVAIARWTEVEGGA
jgi:hypothetical protein